MRLKLDDARLWGKPPQQSGELRLLAWQLQRQAIMLAVESHTLAMLNWPAWLQDEQARDGVEAAIDAARWSMLVWRSLQSQQKETRQ